MKHEDNNTNHIKRNIISINTDVDRGDDLTLLFLLEPKDKQSKPKRHGRSVLCD